RRRPPRPRGALAGAVRIRRRAGDRRTGRLPRRRQRRPGMDGPPGTRHGLRAAALAAVALLVTGCGFRGAYSFSLPGGADVGEDPYTVQVEFLDALDLVQQSGVRVADVPVGRVESIELGEDWTALVTITVNGDVQLPANAGAAVQG